MSTSTQRSFRSSSAAAGQGDASPGPASSLGKRSGHEASVAVTAGAEKPLDDIPRSHTADGVVDLAVERDRARARRVVEYVRHSFPAGRDDDRDVPTPRREGDETAEMEPR